MSTEENFTELAIPKFVWQFVRKILKNPIQAGILAFIVYNFIKDKDTKVKTESLKEIKVDEKAWDKAKKAFRKSYNKEPKTDSDYAIVMDIYNKMTEGLTLTQRLENLKGK